jgi:AraC-like DNA-binding protein
VSIRRYIPPASDPLSISVTSIFRAETNWSTELILPSDQIDILFNPGAPVHIHHRDEPVPDVTWTDVHVSGIRMRPTFARPSSKTVIFGIQLRAEGARRVFGMPIDELTNRTFVAEEVPGTLDALGRRLGMSGSFDEQIRIAAEWFARLPLPGERDRTISHACRLMRASPTPTTVDYVLHESGYSARHLRRLFQRHVGCSPSAFLQLSRLARSLRLMNTSRSLTAIAHEAGYFDQAHFCRDFKTLSGITPTEYRASAGKVPGHVFYR